MGRLVAVDATGRAFVDVMLATWDRGDAVLPVDPRLPPLAARALVATMRAGESIDDDVALVMPTSGTTGTPKGVELTHANVEASALATSAHLGIDPDRHCWLACLPLAHVGGLSVVTRSIVTGTPFIVHDRFEAAAVDTAAAQGATHVSLVATALDRVDAAAWERIVLGGSRPPNVRPPNVSVTYGLTETGSGVVYDRTALDGVELRIADDGEVLLRGPMVASRYRDGSPVTDDDGWLHTGDAGAVTDGVLSVSGRRGDMIISGGENVWPDPVEARLDAHPAVERSAVVGRPDATWGQAVTAVVVASGDGPPTLDGLREWVKETLPAFMAPTRLELVDALPTTALGKVKRQALSRPGG